MEEKMIAVCGLVCTDCPAYTATQKDDDAEREKVAKMWSGMYNVQFTAADINCDGCLSTTGRLFSHCSNCEIRKCGGEKGMVNCAHCSDYGCEKIEGLLKMVPDARVVLDGVRKDLGL